MARRRRPALTRLEGEIMRIVWEREPEAVRVRDVLEALNARRRTPLAYNTIQTMFTILKNKGIVQMVRGPGRAHLYRAKVSRESASRSMVRELLDRLFNGRAQPLLQQLIDESDLSADELASLRAWVDAKLRDAKEQA
jgi:BlaI family transcriptional regulator, penicillinase repressor